MGPGEPTLPCLHLRTVRFLSHAGADLETAYRSGPDIRADFTRDPLLATGRWLVSSGAGAGTSSPTSISRCGSGSATGARGDHAQQMETAEEVMRPLSPRDPSAVAQLAGAAVGSEADEPLTLAQAIDAALAGVARGSPGDTRVRRGRRTQGRRLRRHPRSSGAFGPLRVFDTLLDETTILGLALGTAISGFVPIPEIQYLAYLHNAEDQLRGEAATLQFFSQGAYRNGMVVRIQGYGYQKGFGGHFHNDNGLGVLRDIPGLVVASPARPADAAAMLRTCVAAAKADGRVCVFLEPIALYHTRDLHEDGDELWLERRRRARARRRRVHAPRR